MDCEAMPRILRITNGTPESSLCFPSGGHAGVEANNGRELSFKSSLAAAVAEPPADASQMQAEGVNRVLSVFQKVLNRFS